MNKLFIALAIAAVAVSTARAALDDTQQQIEKRYGQPVKEATTVPPATYAAYYKQGEVTIFVAYIGGRAQYIKYSGKLETGDIEAILKANQAGAQSWVKFSDRKGLLKPRMGQASSCWFCPGKSAEAHKGSGPKRTTFIEFATDTWLKAKAASF
jgi:hypothetical protein